MLVEAHKSRQNASARSEPGEVIHITAHNEL